MDDFNALWKLYNDELRNVQPPPVRIPDMPAPPALPEVQAPPPKPETSQPQGQKDSDSESMVLNDDAPLRTSPESSTSKRSNPPTSGAESRSENLKAADSEMRGKAKVERHISDTAGGFDTVDAAQMELRSAVDPWQ
jgi:hypothetical protein